MTIINQNGDGIVFTDQIYEIYIDSTAKVKASTPVSRGVLLGAYRTEENAVKAIQEIAREIEKGSALIRVIPDSEAAEKYEFDNRARYRHLHGEKTKGHGGS